MKPLPKTLFSGSENIGEQDREKIFVNNFSDSVEKVLGDFFWDGKAAGAIGLTLSNDNKRVESGRFITTGTLVEKSIKVAANEIWEDADESVILTIKLPRADIFKFTDGGLYSQYVDEESVTYYMHSIAEGKPPTPIPVQEKEEWQIGKFCLRQVCYVSKSSTARGGVFLTYVVLIFPTSKDQLVSGSELTANPSWPGLRLCSGEMQLLPRPTTPWRCPVLPLLRTGSEERNLPSSTALRHAIGAIMRKSGSPDIVEEAANLIQKWEHLAEHPGEFAEKTTPITWPEQPTPEPETGKNQSNLHAILFLFSVPPFLI